MTLLTMTTRQKRRTVVALHVIWCCWIYLLVVTADATEQRMHDGQLHALTYITFSCQGRPSGYYPDPKYPCQVYHVCDGRTKRQSFLCSSLEIPNEHSALFCNRSCATRTQRSTGAHHTGSVGAPVTSSSATERSKVPGSKILLEDVPDSFSSRNRGGSHLKNHRLQHTASRNPSRLPRIFSALHPKMHELSTLTDSRSGVSDQRENRGITDKLRCTAAQVNISQQKDVRCRNQTEELKVALPFPSVSSVGARISADAGYSVPRNTFRSLGTRGSFSFGTGVNNNQLRVNDKGIVMLLQVSSVADSTKLFQNRGRLIPESQGARHRVTPKPLVKILPGQLEKSKAASAAVSSSAAIHNKPSSRQRQRTFSTAASSRENKITRSTNKALKSAGSVDIFDISLIIQPPELNDRPDWEKSKKSAELNLSELETHRQDESVEISKKSNPVYFSAFALVPPKTAKSATFSDVSSVLVPTIPGSLQPPLPSVVRGSSTSTGSSADVREGDKRPTLKFATMKRNRIRAEDAQCSLCVRSFIRDLNNCSPCVMIR